MEITTKDIANELGCAPQTVNKYRRKAEAKAGRTFGTQSDTDGRIIIFTSEEASLIKAMAPQRVEVSASEALEAELVSNDDPVLETIQPLSHRLLSLQTPVPPRYGSLRFDHTDADADRTALLQHQSVSANGANHVLTAYARTRISEAVATIDNTIETMTANALASVAEQVGKETGAKKAAAVGGGV
jgi:hypothetical protein